VTRRIRLPSRVTVSFRRRQRIRLPNETLAGAPLWRDRGRWMGTSGSHRLASEELRRIAKGTGVWIAMRAFSLEGAFSLRWPFTKQIRQRRRGTV